MSEWWYMYMKVPVICIRNYMHVSMCAGGFS